MLQYGMYLRMYMYMCLPVMNFTMVDEVYPIERMSSGDGENGGIRNVLYLRALTCEFPSMRLVAEAGFERIRSDLISNPDRTTESFIYILPFFEHSLI